MRRERDRWDDYVNTLDAATQELYEYRAADLRKYKSYVRTMGDYIEDMPEDICRALKDTIPDDVAKKLSDTMPNDISKRLQKDLPEEIIRCMAENFPSSALEPFEKSIDNKSEAFSKKLNEDIHNELMSSYYHIQSSVADECKKQNEAINSQMYQFTDEVNVLLANMEDRMNKKIQQEITANNMELQSAQEKIQSLTGINTILGIVAAVASVGCAVLLVIMKLL